MSPIRVQVSDPSFAYELLSSLRRVGYDCAHAREDIVKVEVPRASTPDDARKHLRFYLANWRGRHPGVVADLLES